MKSGSKGKNADKKPRNSKLSSASEAEFLKKQRAERYQELDALETPDVSNTAKQLEGKMRDKGVSTSSEFEDAGKKTAGIAEGKVVKRKGEDQRYMHKPSPKKLTKNIMNSEAGAHFWDNIRELMAGDMFSLLLYSKAPNIGLVDVDQDYFAIRSRYLENAQTFDAYKKTNTATVQGFEKVIAACFYMGDGDFHGENLMVHQRSDGQYEFDKIDHGRALSYTHKNIDDLFNGAIHFINRMYKDPLESNQVQFNYAVFKNELKSMRERLSPELMDNIIDAKISQLKKIGVEFGEVHEREIQNLKLQMQKHNDRIDVIIGILEIASPELHSITLPTTFQRIKEQNLAKIEDAVKSAIINNTLVHGVDPIKFALYADIKIDNKSALDYALENHRMIDGIDPIAFCILRELKNHIPTKKPQGLITEVQKAVSEGKDIYGVHPIKFAIMANVQIHSKPAIEYAAKRGKKIDGFDPIAFAALNDLRIESKHPIEWAVSNNKKIDGKDPILWAYQQKERINGKDPIVWAIQNNKTIRGIDPWKYAYQHSMEISEFSAIKWAASMSHKINGVDPVIFALRNNLTIDDQHPLKWAITTVHNIEGMNAAIAIDKVGLQIDGKSGVEWLLENDKPGRLIRNAWNYANDNNLLFQGVEPGLWFILNHDQIQGRTTAFNDISAQIAKDGTFLKQGFEKHTTQEKIEFLSGMLDLYHKLDPVKNGDLIAIIKQDYNVIVADINQGKSVVTLQSSGFDKSSSDKIAKKLDKLIKNKDVADVKVDSSALLEKCDFDMAIKVIEIGKALENPVTKDSNGFKACADQICKAFNKLVSSKHNKVTKDDINNTLKVISAERSEDISVDNKPISSFAQKVEQGRNNTQTPSKTI